jgi:sulfatase maturation enzyme AslB (radical SAM superfamily)
VVDRKGNGAGGFDRLTTNLNLMQRPTRFNTTLQIHNYEILPDLARWLAQERDPTVWNLIQFNPFRAWDGLETIDFQVKMTDMAPHIGEAVQIAEAAGFEVNVRYFSFCVAAEHGFEKNCINYYQTQFDPHEWALEATNLSPMDEVRRLGAATARQLGCDAIRDQRMNPKCSECRFTSICEGPTPQYQRRYGTDELRPVRGPPVRDPIWFERNGNSWPRRAS